MGRELSAEQQEEQEKERQEEEKINFLHEIEMERKDQARWWANGEEVTSKEDNVNSEEEYEKFIKKINIRKAEVHAKHQENKENKARG